MMVTEKGCEIALELHELYLGRFDAKCGGGRYHLILQGGQASACAFEQALLWVESSGGSLPTIDELICLSASYPELFDKEGYWSSTRPAQGASSEIWTWNFATQNQNLSSVSCLKLARSVRRVPV